MITQKATLALAILILALTLGGCRSHHIEATVVNLTGQTLELVEIQYPSATFGKNALAPGEEIHYRIQLIGSAPLHVHYFTGAGHLVETNIDGPEVHEPQEGKLKISLLPQAKAQFLPELTQ